MSDLFSDLSFHDIGLQGRLADILTKNGHRGGSVFRFNISTKVGTIKELHHESKGDDGSTRKNVLIKSQTGSGKSLCYLLPIVNDLMLTVPAVKRESGSSSDHIADPRTFQSDFINGGEVDPMLCKCSVG